MKKKKKKVSTTLRPSQVNHNAYLAVDSRTGEVLASLETTMSLSGSAVHLYGLNKVIKDREGKMPDGSKYLLFAGDIVYYYLVKYWEQWVPVSWRRYHRIEFGGGPWWPNKVLKPKVWSDDDAHGQYSHQHGGHGVDKTDNDLVDKGAIEWQKELS